MTAEASDGATPLDADESEGLIPGHLTTRSQLDAWEQENILQAQVWAFSRRGPDPLTVDGLRALHARMFAETWTWAGRFRTTGRNIGVPSAQITTSLEDLVRDARYWIEHRTFPVRASAVRLHHRLVHIHPFANGNGRWARLATDLLLRHNGETPFDWDGGLDDIATSRAIYIAALRSADQGEYAPLEEYLHASAPP